MQINERSAMRLRHTGRGWLGWGLGAVLLLGGCYTGVEPELLAPLRSLEGVDMDGSLTPAPSGAFVLDAGARARFDHFLVAQGEVDEGALHAHVRADINARLQGEAAEQAWEAFLAYLDYRGEAAALLTTSQSPADARRALAEIRGRTIGDAPGVPDEGPRLEAALTLRAALADPSLDARVRAERMAAFQAEVGETPDDVAPARIVGRVRAALAPIPSDDQAARRAVLVELIGDAAADRWLALEQARAAAVTTRG